MHFVYVTACLPYSREETFIVPEIVELHKRGHRVTLIPVRPRSTVIHEDARALTACTVAEPLWSPAILAGAVAEIVSNPRRALGCIRLMAKSRSVKVLAKNLIVFPKGVWLGRLTRRRGGDHIHAHFASTSATVALIASVFSGVPWSFTAHRWDISENNLVDEKARAAELVRAIDARGASELAALAPSQRRKLRVIHMGVPSSGAHVARGARPKGALRVLLAARFDEMKGHRYALDAVARLRRAGVEVLLDCAGDGPLRSTVERYAKALDLSRHARFPGIVDHAELLRGLGEHRWDVALLPSLETDEDREGIPVFLIEAMAAGIPVVATHTGGIPELLHDGAGLLIAQRDAAAIADALAKLAVDAPLRAQLAEAGMRRVREQFTVEASISALLDGIHSDQRRDMETLRAVGHG